MKTTTGPIWDIWNAGGPFLGDAARPHHRVTVEVGWSLRTSVGPVGTYPSQKLPLRWTQRADNSQVEVEVPNIKSIQTTRSLDQTAGTATITLYNQNMSTQGLTELGQPGYYSFDRGVSGNRWGQTPNAWSHVLVPNALLRTYQGYGGYSNGIPDPIPAAVAAGNLVLTGVWLVDEVRISTDFTITLTCRDLGKLLVDQQMFAGLIPAAVYPVHYTRYYQDEIDTSAESYGTVVSRTRLVTGGAAEPNGNGYWLVGDDGGVFSFGLAPFYGSAGGQYSHGVTGIARTRTGKGYYLTTRGGSILYYGDAPNLGELAPGVIDVMTLLAPIVIAIERVNSSTQDGFWICRSDGAVYTFGAAGYYGGNPGGATGIVGMASTLSGNGYWMVDTLGQVYSFGDAVWYGNAPNAPSQFVAIARSALGHGYYLTDKEGHVYSFGDAVYHGGASSIALNDPICYIIVDPLQRGYWLVAQDGGVFTFGGNLATHFNQPTTSITILDSSGSFVGTTTNAAVTDAQHLTFTLGAGLPADNYTLEVASTYAFVGPGPPGLNSEAFTVAFNVGGAPPEPAYGSITVSPGLLPVGYSSQTMTVTGTTAGQLILPFWGSMPGALTIFLPVPGNYNDFADIITDLALWSGFWLEGATHGGLPSVSGAIESTGSFAVDALPDSIFDKVAVIDAMNQIKEIVGYNIFIDEAGGFNFSAPNWWGPGNFLLDGTHTDFLPVVDEKLQMTQYGLSSNDTALRSEIIISSSNPYPVAANSQQTMGGAGVPAAGTVTTVVAPPSAAGLRGLQKPAMWINQSFIDAAAQQVMTELIAIQIWFQERLGSVTAQANPMIMPDNQVQLYERQTGEMYVHYVRAVDSTADLEAGTWTMTLTTNWVGLVDDWAIQGLT